MSPFVQLNNKYHNHIAREIEIFNNTPSDFLVFVSNFVKDNIIITMKQKRIVTIAEKIEQLFFRSTFGANDADSEYTPN